MPEQSNGIPIKHNENPCNIINPIVPKCSSNVMRLNVLIHVTKDPVPRDPSLKYLHIRYFLLILYIFSVSSFDPGIRGIIRPPNALGLIFTKIIFCANKPSCLMVRRAGWLRWA